MSPTYKILGLTAYLLSPEVKVPGKDIPKKKSEDEILKEVNKEFDIRFEGEKGITYLYVREDGDKLPTIAEGPSAKLDYEAALQLKSGDSVTITEPVRKEDINEYGSYTMTEHTVRVFRFDFEPDVSPFHLQ